MEKLDGGLRGGSQRCLSFLEYRLAPFTLAALLAVLAGSIWCWDSWRGEESHGTAIRNLVLIMAPIAALPLAIWRSKVAERQSETAQRGLLNERYQKGVDKLGSETLWNRISGIYALALLAREKPRDYHVQIMGLLCAFVRHTSGKAGEVAASIKSDDSTEEFIDHPVGEDVQEAISAICNRSEAQIEIAQVEKLRLNLVGVNLAGANLQNANLAGANLAGANLQNANLQNANLAGAYLRDVDLRKADLSGANLEGADLETADLPDANLSDANLSGAILQDADLSGARLWNANLSGAHLCVYEGLTQEQIDQAVADSDKPPDLTGVVDAQTGKPLDWNPKAAKQT